MKADRAGTVNSRVLGMDVGCLIRRRLLHPTTKGVVVRRKAVRVRSTWVRNRIRGTRTLISGIISISHPSAVKRLLGL